MSTKSILVYIEGEVGKRKSSRRQQRPGDFRRCWKEFLMPLVEIAKKKQIEPFTCVPGRGGPSTLGEFARPLPGQQNALRILLIDSEGPVDDITKPWNALRTLRRPTWADDNHCYLMVQCLETWLLADPDGLRSYYNQRRSCFQDNKLNAWHPNFLETIPKETLQDALEKATADCGETYEHADGNILIAIVDRAKLLKLPSVNRLFRDLEVKITEYAAAK